MVPTLEAPAAASHEGPAVEEIWILPLREGALFPRAVLPLTLGRPDHIELVLKLGEKQRIGIVAQKDPRQDNPRASELREIGTIGYIHRILRTAPDLLLVFCEGIARFRTTEFTSTEPPFRAKVQLLPDTEPEPTPAIQSLREHLIETVKQVIAATPELPDELQLTVANIPELGHLADFVGGILPGLTLAQRRELLTELDVATRLRKVNDFAIRELERVQLRQKIHVEAHGALDQAQREFFLREQLKAIQKELGEGEESQKDIEELRQRVAAAGMPAEVEAEASKELKRLAVLSPMSPEHAVARNYLEWMVCLPWSVSTGTAVDVNHASKILDEDHHNLEKVKDRILDFLAVLQLRPTSKGPILCFTGAPGVGKTSLGKSIARALGR